MNNPVGKCPYCDIDYTEVIMDIGFCDKCRNAYFPLLGKERLMQSIQSVLDFCQKHREFLFNIKQKQKLEELNEDELLVYNSFDFFRRYYRQFKNTRDFSSDVLSKEKDEFYFPYYHEFKQFVSSISKLILFIEKYESKHDDV